MICAAACSVLRGRSLLTATTTSRIRRRDWWRNSGCTLLILGRAPCARRSVRMWLRDRVAFITGGTRGIGRATALRFAAERPAHIALGYVLDHDAARATVAEVQALGVDAYAICADVAHEDHLRCAFEQIAGRHGRLDVLVSNAARTSFGPLLDLTPRTWQRVLDLNARAFLIGAQLA